jgi:hypothetical protein
LRAKSFRLVSPRRQGLRISGKPIPPGPRGSNGPLSRLVVVPWRSVFLLVLFFLLPGLLIILARRQSGSIVSHFRLAY